MEFSSMSRNPDVTLSLSVQQSPTTVAGLKPEERSIKLIQLLITCANQTSSSNLHHADACLRQISRLASTTGDSTQRLAARFASALAARIIKRWPGLYKALTHSEPTQHDLERFHSNFFRLFPYMGFAYAIINRTLTKAMSGERAIHVIDLGCSDPKLWVPFIRAIANGLYGPPRLKITCIGRNKEAQEKLRHKLVKEAESFNMPFQFSSVNTRLRDFHPQMLNVESHEAVAFTSVSRLHTLLAEDDRVDIRFKLGTNDEVKECKQMSRFLESIKSFNPKVLLLVEREANHNMIRLMDRFLEGLHFYGALFDSIDVAYNGYSCSDRTELEAIFGREIENIVAGEGLDRKERHERYANWAIRFGKTGFRTVRLWYDAFEDARRVVEGCGSREFKVINENGSLMICWHDRPIYAVSAWDCLN